MGLVPTMCRALHLCNQGALCGAAYGGNDVGNGPCHQDATIELVTIRAASRAVLVGIWVGSPNPHCVTLAELVLPFFGDPALLPSLWSLTGPEPFDWTPEDRQNDRGDFIPPEEPSALGELVA